MTPTYILLAIIFFLAFSYIGRGYIAWVVSALTILVAMESAGVMQPTINFFIAVTIVAATVFGIKPLRRALVTNFIMKIVAKTMPTISETEATALNAGTVWWESELFSGKPNWNKLLNFKIKKLTKAERDFLNGPVEEFCKIISDEQTYQDRDLSPKAWAFIKKHKLFGIIIPKKFGGLGFSAAAHAAIITKISSRSVGAAVTVMVPNSLGPGELLVHYGTPEQKKRYLKNLAEAKDIPCFALTEPHAGSDAANGRATGVICEGKWEGKKTIGIKVTFDKRYITLSPIATVVGLAFRLTDPDHLIGDKEEIGITCALLPRDTKGLKIGNQHDPVGVPFLNGTVQGTDVFIPLDYVIGGEEGLGKGWRMLMEQLSAGRGISLPSLSIGAAQLATRTVGAYSQVREQFGLPIGRFEGVRERIASVAAHAYFMTATGKLTVGAVDAGERPSVCSAIAKAYLTEGMRSTINNGMDILGGAAICQGDRNIFARAYCSIPVGITVEGANILTRSLIIFGQGAIRCHPFVLKQTTAIANKDLKAFDNAFYGHINHVARNGARAFVSGFTGGRLTPVPVKGSGAGKYYRRLNRLSAGYAFAADIALGTLGGALKRKEYLSGRFADGLSWLYIASAVLKHDADNNHPTHERAVRDYVLETACAKIEAALDQILRNLPNRLAANVALLTIFPLGVNSKLPDDAATDKLVDALLSPDDKLRESLTQALHIPAAKQNGLGKLEAALEAVKKAAEAKAKINKARRKGKITKGTWTAMAAEAKTAKIITAAEAKKLTDADKLVDDVVQVNVFTQAEYQARS